MRHIEEYKCLEDDPAQNKGKAPVVSRPLQGRFSIKAPKGLKDLKAGGTDGGGKCNI